MLAFGHRLNARIKAREPFRSFASSFLRSLAPVVRAAFADAAVFDVKLCFSD
jgi:predicted NodU family carbamoyl transferase